MSKNPGNSSKGTDVIPKPTLLNEIKSFLISCCDKEIRFHTDIVPTLLQFQFDNNITQDYDFFPIFYGSKNNKFVDNSVVDENTEIILENLEEKGYSITNRTNGFDLEGAKLIVTDLAKFHGITLALKLKKPEVYDTKIKTHCFPLKFPPNKTLKHVQQWLETILNRDEYLPYKKQLKEKFDKGCEGTGTFFKRSETEPWATLIHNQTLIYHTMQLSENGKLVKNKFLNFDIYTYGSPLCDLVFFIWTSVETKVIQEHVEELYQHYHGQFVSVLEEFGCDTSPFGYQEFLEQLNEHASKELFHIVYFCIILYADKETLQINLPNERNEFTPGSISKTATERMEFVVQDFGRRGWIVC